MSELLDALGRNGPRHEQQATITSSIPPTVGSASKSFLSLSQLTPLPTWENVLAIAELYLLYCDSQPLPLFHRDSFLSSLGNRDAEIIYAILALSVRFAEDQYRDANDLAVRINGYTEVARNLVMKRVSEGPVELSTLQCLCLLSLVDFTNGNTHRSSIHSSLAMNLAQCANLASESHIALSPAAREERRRCFWSICLLKRLHGMEFDELDLPDGSFPPYPESLSMPQPRSPTDMADGARSTDLKDQGIVAAAVVATIELQLSFTENLTIRQEKRDRFCKCVNFVQRLGERWPYMVRLADRLQRLEDAVSASYQPESGAQNKSLLIDLSRFWEILEYSSTSDSDSARRMFGDSLYSEPPTFAAEVSQTSPLPEPFRLSSQHELSHASTPQYNLQPPIPIGAQYTVEPGTTPRPDLLDDEFSILAANFFSQGQEFLRNFDNRQGTGNF
ncbi:hypothetical protein BBP40_002845 [Aspergillus hancockii]|nr:hypothetical protein BBP40_002845 [Aspergillus hancockii]